MVHEVNLGEHTNCATAEWIDMACKLQCFRVHNIHVSRRYCEDDAVWFGDILGDEISGLLLDVRRLISNRNLYLCQNCIARNAELQ